MPAPIPHQELVVRARLEDLIDQVQQHLGGLTTTVSELEELQKQRASLQDWITAQRAAVVEWSSRPTKLRPEAAKQELSAMNELLNTVGDRRNQLLTELSALEDDDSDLELALNNLEDELTAAIAQKQAGQNVIEEYRQRVQVMHGWFDNLLKRSETVDKGSGLNCAQKQTAIVELQAEFEDQGPKKLDEIKRLAAEVIDVVSNLDSQQVEEQLKSIERRYNDISKRLQRKMQVLEMTRKGIEGTRDEIDQARDWVKERMIEVQKPVLLGYESKNADDRVQYLKGLLKEAEGKAVLQETLAKRVSNMTNELEPAEQTQLESSLKNLSVEQKELVSVLKAEIDKTSSAANVRRKLELDLEKAHAWLKAKHSEIRKLSGYLPLKSQHVEQEIIQHKAHESDIREFSEGDLADMVKQGNNLLKECNEADRERLQKLLNAVNHEYETLKNDAQQKISALGDLLQGRKQFENDVDKCQRWLNEAEVATSTEIRATNIGVLEEQLAKYDKLNREAAQVSDDIDRITEQGKAILPTVSEADKLSLSEQLKAMRDKHARIAAVIRDRTNALKDSIQQQKEAAARIAESVQFMNQIQKELKDLNRPIGNKSEDVVGMLTAYEKILGDLKANKAKLGDLSAASSSDLQGIVGQQDDLIRSIEDQIARLRQLLLLREQFIALITEIMTFITKYTGVVRDIEKSGTTVQEKIKRYDDLIVKIQECEALLASASDKGQQIAADGSSADRNAIAEQLQSLKQSLQTLRRTVEKQRQEHEMTAAEHRKLAIELEEILDWLHANEAAVHSRPLLNRDIGSVEREIEHHHTLSNNVNKYLDKVRHIQDATRHDDGMPSSLLEQLSEANSLLASLPRELEERAKYLENNKQFRAEYSTLTDKLHAWVKEAEIRLQSGKDGVDFENILSDLEEHKIFFSTEGSIKELVSQQIQQAADKIWPSLTPAEQEELSREQQQHTQLLKNTLNSAKSQRAQLEQDAEMWKDYCQTLDKVKSVLARSQFTDEPVTTLAGLHFNVQKITHALNDIQNQQLELDLLLERAAEISQQADTVNKQKIQEQSGTVSEQWLSLVSGLESRRDTLTKLAQLWENFEGKWQGFESQVTTYEERAKHIDLIVRSKQHVVDSKSSVEELLADVEALQGKHEEILSLSKTVLGFLRECSKQSAETLSAKLLALTQSYERCFRREMKKIEDSKRSGAGADEIYETHLWYYDLLLFTKDQEMPRRSVSNIVEKREGESGSEQETDDGGEKTQEVEYRSQEIEHAEGDVESQMSPPASCLSRSSIHSDRNQPISSLSSTPVTNKSSKRKRKNKIDEQTDEVLTMVGERLRNNVTDNDDAFNIFGKHVAAKLRALPKQTKLYTEKLINDLLFEAEIGHIDKNTKIVTYGSQ